MSNSNNKFGGFYVLLFFILLGVLGWVYGETDNVKGLAGHLMKVIIFIAVFAVAILWIKEKERK